MKRMEQQRSLQSRQELSHLHRGLATAPDAQIARIVAMVDAMDNRGAADDMIAPLRPRLAQLRPPRPLRFGRLLFIPLDTLIVPTPEWRQDDPTLPRSAIEPLAQIVRDAMRDTAQAIDDAIKGQVASDVQTVRSAGRILWPGAAAILATSETPPAAWAKAQLPAACFVPIAQCVAVLLGQTDRLDTLFAESDIGVTLQQDALAPLLGIAAARDANTLTMMIALVLARLPAARQLLGGMSRLLGITSSAMSRSIEQALTVLVDRLETRGGVETLVIGSQLDQAANEVRRILDLLDGLYAQRQADDWPSRLAAIMRRLNASCRLRFAVALEVEFEAALQAPRSSALEDAARGLRALQEQAARIGGSSSYQEPIEQAVGRASNTAISLIDRVRLVEILLGPDEALALLEAA